MRLLVAGVVVLALGVVGGWMLFNALDEDAPEEPATAAWNTCTNAVHGFSIDFPPGWHTDHRAPELACFNFDPRPFEAPLEGEITTAMQVAIERTPDPVGDPTKFERAEDGLAVYGYRVPADDGEREFVVSTTNNEGVEFDAWKTIVDKAVGTMRFETPGARPVDGAGVVPPEDGLPEAVARKRAEIWTAARTGDYAKVAALVASDGFRYTFGGPVEGGPAAYWERLDQTTKEQPLPTLVAILQLPYVRDPQSGLYVWPYAFTRKASTLTPAEKAELTEALGMQTVKGYEQLDSYLGYRAGIDEEGDWVFYVAGD
jgi:hypothetical protein